MYCSTCGVAVAQGLAYCSFCGAKLNAVKGEDVNESSEVRPGLLISAMVAVFVFGLVAITMFVGMMKAVVRLDAGQIFPFTVLSFLIMLLVEGVCIWLLFRRNRGVKETGATLPKEQATKELDAAQARVLPEPLPSVTEHTTRTFEPLYNERSSK
jgi:hypothetical protein